MIAKQSLQSVAGIIARLFQDLLKLECVQTTISAEMFSEQLASQLLYSRFLPRKKLEITADKKNLLLLTAVEKSEQKLQYLDLSTWTQFISLLTTVSYFGVKEKHRNNRI